jgi:hypothetical protein
MTINNDFGVICVDNFYSNPDKVVEFAHSCEYNIFSPNYPGKRTAPLFEINNDFYLMFTKKLLSTMFDLDNTMVNFSIDTRFSKISKISDDEKINMGGIHLDNSPLDNENIAFAGIIYLNKNYDLNCGTSLFKINTRPPDNLNTMYVPWEEYATRDKTEYRQFFTETIRFQNIYNRLVLYDASYLHGINKLANDNEDRLVQVFFCDKITTDSPPPRWRASSYDYNQ